MVTMNSAGKSPSPRLPGLLALPFSLLPEPLHAGLIARVLSSVLRDQIRQGELDFLQGRSLTIRVRDAGFGFQLACRGSRLVAADRGEASDLVIEGNVYDFLQLISREADADTLVFQRRLVMQGDTELGLEVKNFLDSLDVESIGLYNRLVPHLRRALGGYRRIFG